MDRHQSRKPGFLSSLAVVLVLVVSTSLPAQAAPQATAQTAPQAARQDPPRWEADIWFDRFRPTITPRELTKEEREEVRALVTKLRAATPPWRARNLIERGQPVGELRQQATLLRLFELGTSGDEEAMLAARDAIYSDGNCGGWGDDAPFRVGNDGNGECAYAQGVALGLAAYWTALIWQHHGPERSGAADIALKSCFGFYKAFPHSSEPFIGRNPYVQCGFSMTVTEAALKSRDMKRRDYIYLDVALFDYRKKGGKPPLAVHAFFPTVGDAEFDRQRFQKLLASYKPAKDPDALGLATGWTETDRAWVEHYAEVNQRNGDVKAMLERKDRQLADEIWRANQSARMMRESACDKGLQSLATTHLRVTDYEVRSLEGTCAGAGDDYLEKFAQRYMVVTPANVDRLCNAGSATCTRLRAGQAQRNAEFAAEEKAKRDALNNAFTGKLPPASVNVRKYDQNGNYIGTETMTRGEADLRGAK